MAASKPTESKAVAPDSAAPKSAGPESAAPKSGASKAAVLMSFREQMLRQLASERDERAPNAVRSLSPKPKSDISDFGHLGCRTRVNPSSGGRGLG